jgi:hypothetical protein
VIRRYSSIKLSTGTRWPVEVLTRLRERDRLCVGYVIGMPGECFGSLEPDHVRASGGIGMKSRSTLDNGALLCAAHHRLKTENGRVWRPVLLAYIEGRRSA